MKRIIHTDERVIAIRGDIYRKLFWLILLFHAVLSNVDLVAGTQLSGWVLPLAPFVLVLWMALRGALFCGEETFPRWCWGGAVLYGAINAVLMLWLVSAPGLSLYLPALWQRLVMTAAAFLVPGGLLLLVLWAAFCQAKRKLARLVGTDACAPCPEQ